MPDVRKQAEQLFRAESGRILASLIRIAGSIDLAEEAMQEAFAAALAQWPAQGLPDNPGAWITAAGRRKLIDRFRRDRTRREKQDLVAHEMASSTAFPVMEEAEMDFPDERLRLIFTCCHPALNREAQVVLTLRTLCGLTTPEIARAFLTPETTLAQRIVRAKKKIRDARIPYETPPRDLLPERLESVRAVIYLVFNEGYGATEGDQLVRNDLCAEAIRLGRMICGLLPDQPESLGLLALMLLHHSRRHARQDATGALVTLEEQDRSLWDAAAIAEGVACTRRALAMGKVGPYQLQAAIAAVHAEARTPGDTDWAQIEALYGEMHRILPTPVVELNHAVAVAMSAGLEAGLQRIDKLGEKGELEVYYLFHAARADLLRRLERGREAEQAYTRALELVTNRAERDYLSRRLRELNAAP